MSERKRHSSRSSTLQYKANLVTPIRFIIEGTISYNNHRVNYAWEEAVASLIKTEIIKDPVDCISIEMAIDLTARVTGNKVGRTAVTSWVSNNNLGRKLPGRKGQWIVFADPFKEYLIDQN